jgi:hypothetical protein
VHLVVSGMEVSVSKLNNVAKDDLERILKYFSDTIINGSSADSLNESLDSYLCCISTLLFEAGKERQTIESIR